MATILINRVETQVPAGAIAYKYADPTEGARWVYDQSDLAEIRREDPSLIVEVPQDGASPIDMSIVGGKYQGLTGYTLIGGGAKNHPRPAADSKERTAEVVAALVSAGFQQSQPGGNWYHVAGQRQARIAIFVPGGPEAKDGEVLTGTIGIEMWTEPHAALLLGR